LKIKQGAEGVAPVETMSTNKQHQRISVMFV